MKALIKIGGTLLDSAQSRSRLAMEITEAIADGLQAVVVHGGGKQMTRYLADHGIESQFVNGLRVTTPEVLDAVLKVFAGSVNQELVGAFVAAGSSAVGLTGMDALITEAEQWSQELGQVGKPVKSDPRLLDLLVKNGHLPVVACVAGDCEGQFYNVNADQMAASVAAAIQADKLIFLTDVEGVRGADSVIYSKIRIEECSKLIRDQVATGGMQAKLEAAIAALGGGVRDVTIAPGAVSGIIAKLLAGEKIGTRLLAFAAKAVHRE